MCGIVGYIDLNGKDIDPGTNATIIQAMCRSIHHRGPDDSGELLLGPAALGMTRLSIIDLSTGHQPIANEDGTVWIVFNGEIYNYRYLQRLLRDKGHKLGTETDTEVVVHLYEEFGTKCLDFLEGMFAFALWDQRRQRLFIARDRMGEKPLHFGLFADQFIFASELKGLLAHPAVRKELDIEALQKYLALEYVPAPLSIFRNIYKLLPAHYLIVENGDYTMYRYWEAPALSRFNCDEVEAEARLLELLSESVKLRMIADVPVGVFLSGGIDSSTIAALAVMSSSSRVRTFSIGFDDTSFDESVYADKVARHLGTDHTLAWFPSELALSTLEQLWQYLDEPLADASCLPTFFLAKVCRKSVKVALAGEGGDELFGGYPTYQAHKLAGIWGAIPPPLRRGILEPVIRSLPVSFNNLSLDFKAKRFIEAAEQSPLNRHFRWMGALPVSEQIDLLCADIVKLTAEESIFPSAAGWSADRDRVDLLSRIMTLDMNTYLPDDLLVKSDRSSMAASLEVRLPFLAHPLVEFAVSLPSSYKLRGMTTKYLLKKAAAHYLPDSIMRRPKKGFGIPVGKWLNDRFKPLVDELLCESLIRRQGLFNWEYIDRLRKQHEEGKFDRRKQLWTLLMFQWWWHKFLG